MVCLDNLASRDFSIVTQLIKYINNCTYCLRLLKACTLCGALTSLSLPSSRHPPYFSFKHPGHTLCQLGLQYSGLLLGQSCSCSPEALHLPVPVPVQRDHTVHHWSEGTQTVLLLSYLHSQYHRHINHSSSCSLFAVLLSGLCYVCLWIHGSNHWHLIV